MIKAKLSTGLEKLSEEDPTFKYKTDPETGQTIISGMGELHLEIITDRFKENLMLMLILENLRLLIKNVLNQKVKAEGKFVRQTGGRGQYGHCILEIEPRNVEKGFLMKVKLLVVEYQKNLFLLLKRVF